MCFYTTTIPETIVNYFHERFLNDRFQLVHTPDEGNVASKALPVGHLRTADSQRFTRP